MQYGTKEFYEIMNAFERSSSNIGSYGFGRLEKETVDLQEKGIYYCDAKVNDAFKFFQAGYALCKSIQNLNDGQNDENNI